MKIKLIVVGKQDELFLKLGSQFYLDKLKHYCNVEIIEYKEIIEKEISTNVNLQSLQIINNLEDKYQDYEWILLDIHGNLVTSEYFSQVIEQNKNFKTGKIVFVIAASYGFDTKYKNKFNRLISFGKITLPHQLCRIVILEQIFRSFKIIKGENYHK